MEKRVVLIVDDDIRLRQLLKKYLEQNDLIVTEASDADEADDLLQYLKPDAVIMDIMMPHKRGDVFTAELRKKGFTTPILILTARGDTDSRIDGLEAGADDYLAKPFEPKELLLRLNNIIKRQFESSVEEITFGPYCYHRKKGILKKGTEVITLTTAEHALLDALVAHLNQDVSREQLAQWTNVDNERTIDVQITRLRKKLNTDINFIQTIRGKGYRLINT